MADQTNETLFREIDEELRQDQVQKVWKRYGRLILIGAALCVAAVAGYQIWHNQDLKERRALSEKFVKAQQQAAAGEAAEAEAAFRALADEGGGYGLLARFQQAAVDARAGRTDEALAAYRAIATDGKASALYKDLAALLAAGLELNRDGTDAEALKARLTTLAAAGNPWRHGARELLAALAMKTGDTAAAREQLEALAKDQETPARMRQRASELLTILR